MGRCTHGETLGFPGVPCFPVGRTGVGQMERPPGELNPQKKPCPGSAGGDIALRLTGGRTAPDPGSPPFQIFTWKDGRPVADRPRLAAPLRPDSGRRARAAARSRMEDRGKSPCSLRTHRPGFTGEKQCPGSSGGKQAPVHSGVDNAGPWVPALPGFHLERREACGRPAQIGRPPPSRFRTTHAGGRQIPDGRQGEIPLLPPDATPWFHRGKTVPRFIRGAGNARESSCA